MMVKNVLSALVAEDEMLVRQLIVDNLEDVGFSVTAVSSAAEALDVIETRAPLDLLFTDIRTPGSIDGWELGRRALALLPDLKVVYATGLNDDGALLSVRERKLIKPFRFDEVVAILKSLQLL